MATITLRVSDDELALIDEMAGTGNRSRFMLNAAREAAMRVQRERLDAEVGRILAEGANEDATVLADWSTTASDGIE